MNKDGLDDHVHKLRRKYENHKCLGKSLSSLYLSLHTNPKKSSTT